MTRNLTSVLNLNGLSDWLINKNVSEINFLLSKVSFGTQTFTFELKRKPFLCTRNIAVSHTVIGAGSYRHKSNSDGDLWIGPYFSNQRLNSKDFILEQKQVIFNRLSDSLIFPCQREFCPFSFSLQVLTMIKLLFGWWIISHIIFLLLIFVWWVDNFSQQHQLFCLLFLELLVKKLLFRFLLFLRRECSPFKRNFYIWLVDNV